MSGKKIKKILRETMLLLMIIAVAAGIELTVFQFHPIVKGEKTDLLYKEEKELPEGIAKVVKRKNGVRIILDHSTYIQKIQLELDTSEALEYKIYTKYKNAFDKEEIGLEEDIYRPELGAGYTNIGKKVRVISINLPKELPWKIESIRLYTAAQINRCRIAWIAAALFFIMLFFRRWKWLIRKPEWLFLAIGLTVGSLFVYLNGVQENGWDEQIHFMTAYQLSFSGNTYESNDTIQIMGERIPKDAYNTVEEKELFTQYLNHGYGVHAEKKEKTIRWSYKQAGYAIQAAAVWLGRMLQLPFSRLYMLGRFINLCTYLFLMFFAIKLMPKRKEVILALALIPTQLFIASTYTYDVTVHGCLLLGFVLWMKIILEDKNPKMMYYLLGSIGAFMIGSLSKAVYIPLVLLCGLIPKEKFRSERQYRVFWGIILGGFLLLIFSFALPVLKLLLTNQVGVMGDSRGGDTDVVLQAKSILHHPVSYLLLLGREFFQSIGDFLFGTEGLANFGRMKTMDQQMIFVLFPWILFVTFVREKKEKISFSGKTLAGMGISALLIAGLIWSAMYLVYTPVGIDRINGVQARYYFPILGVCIFLFSCCTTEWKLKNHTLYWKLVSVVPLVCVMMAIWKMFLLR